MNRIEIRVEILKGIAVAPSAFDDAVLLNLEERVIRKQPDDPAMYAYVVGRNWTISARRAATRMARQRLEETQKAERVRVETERYEGAVQEFKKLLAQLSLTVLASQLKSLMMVQLTVFERKCDSEAALIFPGTSDARYQWKRRGLRLLWPHASENLRHILSRGAWHGRAF